jgi:hypothetical protein
MYGFSAWRFAPISPEFVMFGALPVATSFDLGREKFAK